MNIPKVYYRAEESEVENNGSEKVVVGTNKTPAVDAVITKQECTSVEGEIKDSKSE